MDKRTDPLEHQGLATSEPISALEAGSIEASRHQIEETRAEMAATLDAIQDLLSPQHLMTEAQQTVREAATATIEQAEQAVNQAVSTARKTAEPALDAAKVQLQELTDKTITVCRGIAALARQQPGLFVLAGLGIGLLLVQSRRHRTPVRR